MSVKRIKHIDASRLVKKASGIAILAVAEQGVTLAANFAPVDEGHLKGSLTAEKKSKDTAIYGSNVEYAPYQEFGTSKMSAQPYLRPSADKLKTSGSRIYAKVLKGVLKHGK